MYDSDDQDKVVKAALDELNLDQKKFKPAAIKHAISAAKNELIMPEEYRPDEYFKEIAGRVYPRYNALLRASNALDFDDLLMETVCCCRTTSQCANAIRALCACAGRRVSRHEHRAIPFGINDGGQTPQPVLRG